MTDKLFNLFGLVVVGVFIYVGCTLIWSIIKEYFDKRNEKDLWNTNYGGLRKYNRMKTFCYIIINEINERKSLIKRGLNVYEDEERLKRFRETLIYFDKLEYMGKYFVEEDFIYSNFVDSVKEMKLLEKELLDDKTYNELNNFNSVVRMCDIKINHINDCIKKGKKYKLL